MNYGKYIKRAKELIDKLKHGEEFNLPDLFGDEWDKIPEGERKGLGREFRKLVEDGKIQGVKPIGKKSNNLWQYEKI